MPALATAGSSVAFLAASAAAGEGLGRRREGQVAVGVAGPLRRRALDEHVAQRRRRTPGWAASTLRASVPGPAPASTTT